MAANVKKFGKFFIQAWGDDPTGGLGGGGRTFNPRGVTRFQNVPHVKRKKYQK